MFELEKSSLFFESMARDFPEVVQNIEIVYENVLSLDESYHQPKHFILSLNNSLRSLLFLIEISVKNSPDWLRQCVGRYRDENRNDYEILKRLRDVSAHQSLIVPAESLVLGLFRIRSSKSYMLKIGMGDIDKPKNYSWDQVMRNTEEIFHDILVFHSLAFMDLEHAAISECLGITRKWLFRLSFKTDQKRYDELIDVYELVGKFSLGLLDRICEAYAEEKGIKFTVPFSRELAEYNHINTLLEIDLYPTLFADWWESEIEPLNYGVRASRFRGDRVRLMDEIHVESYKELCSSPEEYKTRLTSYIDMPVEKFLAEENINAFYSFIYVNHWHIKKAFDYNLLNSPVEPVDIMRLQRHGKVFLEESRKEKLCTIASSGENLKEQFRTILEKLTKAEETENA